jgi:hypothetical protein
MNESGGRPGPLDVAALADLDAGLPDEDRAARARAAAAADPEAAAVLDALAATRAELAALPTPEVPAAVAARWTAALAAEATVTRVPVTDARRRDTDPCGGADAPLSRDLGPRGGQRRRVGRRAWPPLVAAAVLAAVVATGLGALVHRPAPAVTRVELVALGRAAVGTMDVGDLADPARRATCLRAVAPAAAEETLLGGRTVVLDGHPGVLLVLATGSTGALRILTVDPTCGGPQGGSLIAQLVVE